MATSSTHVPGSLAWDELYSHSDPVSIILHATLLLRALRHIEAPSAAWYLDVHMGATDPSMEPGTKVQPRGISRQAASPEGISLASFLPQA